jgi:AraC family transcriptional regulator, transcriptional activator of pobA
MNTGYLITMSIRYIYIMILSKKNVIREPKKNITLGIKDIVTKVTLGERESIKIRLFPSENFALLNNVVDLSCAIPVKTDHYAIIIAHSGSCLKTSGRAEFEIQPKTLHFISPGMIHAYTGISGDLDLSMVLFKSSFIAESYIKEDIFDQLVELSPVIAPYFTLTDERYETFTKLLDAMHAEYDEGKPFSYQLLKLLTVQMLYEMNRTCEECLIHSSRHLSRQYQLVSAYRKLIDENFLTMKTVKEFSEKLHVSTKQLAKVVRDETGQSPLQIIHNRIYLEAQFMLSSTGLSIKQIAYHLGFDTSSHFGRFFKQCSGLNPTEFKPNNN